MSADVRPNFDPLIDYVPMRQSLIATARVIAERCADRGYRGNGSATVVESAREVKAKLVGMHEALLEAMPVRVKQGVIQLRFEIELDEIFSAVPMVAEVELAGARSFSIYAGGTE